MMIPAEETFNGSWPYQPHSSEAAGFRQHYVDEGPADGELGSTVLSVMKIVGFENSSAVDQTWIDAYSAPFPDRASCKGAIEFPLDVHLDRFREYIVAGLQTGNLEQLRAKPAMLAYGMKDRAIRPENAIADFQALFPAAPVSTFEDASHFCQEDISPILVALIHQFIQMNP